MTAHNKVVTADTVSWPLPIITLDTFASSDSLTRDLLRHVLFCHFSGKSNSICICLMPVDVILLNIYKFRASPRRLWVTPKSKISNFLSTEKSCFVWSFGFLVFLILGVISILCRLRQREVGEEAGGGVYDDEESSLTFPIAFLTSHTFLQPS